MLPRLYLFVDTLTVSTLRMRLLTAFSTYFPHKLLRKSARLIYTQTLTTVKRHNSKLFNISQMVIHFLLDLGRFH